MSGSFQQLLEYKKLVERRMETLEGHDVTNFWPVLTPGSSDKLLTPQATPPLFKQLHRDLPQDCWYTRLKSHVKNDPNSDFKAFLSNGRHHRFCCKYFLSLQS